MPTHRLFFAAPLLFAAALAPPCTAAETAAKTAARPGFVAGPEKPAGDGPAIEVPGGWMVAYEETITCIRHAIATPRALVADLISNGSQW